MTKSFPIIKFPWTTKLSLNNLSRVTKMQTGELQAIIYLRNWFFTDAYAFFFLHRFISVIRLITYPYCIIALEKIICQHSMSYFTHNNSISPNTHPTNDYTNRKQPYLMTCDLWDTFRYKISWHQFINTNVGILDLL